jgi:hypothetical protein
MPVFELFFETSLNFPYALLAVFANKKEFFVVNIREIIVFKIQKYSSITYVHFSFNCVVSIRSIF